MAKIEIERPSCVPAPVIYPRFAQTPSGGIWVKMKKDQKWLLLARGEGGPWRIGDQTDPIGSEYILSPGTKLHITVE